MNAIQKENKTVIEKKIFRVPQAHPHKKINELH